VSGIKKKNSPDWQMGLNFYSPIQNSARIWRVGEWLSAPLIAVLKEIKMHKINIAQYQPAASIPDVVYLQTLIDNYYLRQWSVLDC
jgi:hypothetical protein